jgi:hypothetical protein
MAELSKYWWRNILFSQNVSQLFTFAAGNKPKIKIEIKVKEFGDN